MSKKKFNKSAIVFSTNPDVMREQEEQPERDYLPVEKQKITVKLDKKQRAGKTVTLISGFDAEKKVVEAIGKELKKYCGAGGTAEDSEILIQGDVRQKASQWLRKNNYKNIKVI